ncbi:unnamed protein product, partial [Rotaria socialis]
MMLQYLLLFIIIEHYTVVIFADVDIEHAAAFVRREIWNWWDYTDG